MKKIILFCVCTGLFVNLFAQRRTTEAPPSPEKQAYLQKSKKLWRAAIITVAVGGAVAITGVAIAASEDDYIDSGEGTTGGALFIAGCAVMLSSLCFSIPASINKRKARAISFKNEPSLQLQQGMVLTRFVPSLNLKFGLGRQKGNNSLLPEL